MHRSSLSGVVSAPASRLLRVVPRPAGLALAAALGAAGLVAVIPAGPASAASAGCTTSGSTVTCIFTETGSAQTWTVPAGVTSATFTLYGAKGGAGLVGAGAGGLGAMVTGTLPVTAGTVLQVNAGQAGTLNGGSTFGGGGSTGSDGSDTGSGGGASDVRSPASPGSYPLANRLLVAGGGGGGGAAGFSEQVSTVVGGAGGNAGEPGGNGGSVPDGGATLGGGQRGGAGTTTGGGAGGDGGTQTGTGTCGEITGGGTGQDGILGAGGNATGDRGGGGGGGYYGGGSGGGGLLDIGPGCSFPTSGDGGGGGGASYTGTATSTSVSDGVAAPDDAPNGEVIISYQVLAVTTTSLPGGVVGSAYGPATLAATGGVPPYTWSVPPGTLPPGLSLSTAGVISGTPTSYGTFDFTVTVSDSETPAMTASQALSIVVAPPPLVITTTSLPAATGGQPYSATLAATGGIPPYSWSVTAGSLPPGLTLSTAGVISGTPDVAGTYDFTVTVTDSESPAMTASEALSIFVSGPVITALRPDSGSVFGGTPVVITGTGLSCPPYERFSCLVSVTFGGHRAFVLFASPTLLEVFSPPGHGTVQVTVKVGGVSSQATAAGLFTYQFELFRFLL